MTDDEQFEERVIHLERHLFYTLPSGGSQHSWLELLMEIGGGLCACCGLLPRRSDVVSMVVRLMINFSLLSHETNSYKRHTRSSVAMQDAAKGALHARVTRKWEVEMILNLGFWLWVQLELALKI